MNKNLLARRTLAPLFTLMVFMVAGCQGAAPVAIAPTRTAAATQPVAPVASPTSPVPTAEAAYNPTINPADFVGVVDNPFFPIIPGTTYIYEGKTEKGNEHVEVAVAPEPKVIMGVTCVAVSDVVMVDGQLEEKTTDWYAQDKQGNVWYFGEDTAEYADGKVAGTHGAWEAGVNGAKPGIIMKATSAVGDTYRQEYYKGEAEDMATVLSLSDAASVPVGSYSDVLVTKEWSALNNPPVYEHKYYAKGVGAVLTKGFAGGGWELRLVEIRR